MALKTYLTKNIILAFAFAVLYSNITCYTKRATNVYASTGSRESKSIYNVSHKDAYDSKVISTRKTPNKSKNF